MSKVSRTGQRGSGHDETFAASVQEPFWFFLAGML
jgi:hypothetical protein